MVYVRVTLEIEIDVKNHMDLVEQQTSGAKRWFAMNIFRGTARKKVEETIGDEVASSLVAELPPRVREQIAGALSKRGVSAAVKARSSEQHFQA